MLSILEPGCVSGLHEALHVLDVIHTAVCEVSDYTLITPMANGRGRLSDLNPAVPDYTYTVDCFDICHSFIIPLSICRPPRPRPVSYSRVA